uniref:Uncharacterized protein n=1 Tax=Trichinella nativa TaxID=6335 RepID=A0A0V1KGM7_9BILA
MGWIPRWGNLWMVIPSVSALNFVSFHVVCELYPGYSELLG